jgi:glycosyltransferase involved in cell wall biosynthesis
MQENIRVLVIDLSKRYGGASVRALYLAHHLRSWGSAIAGLENSPVIKIARERDIPVKLVGRERFDPLIPLRLSRVIHEAQFLLIDTQNIQSKFWASFTTLITGVAFVSTLNSSYRDEQGNAWKGKIYALIDWWTNFNVDRFIAVSQPIKRDLIKTGVPEGMVDLITNAVDIDSSLLIKDPMQMRREVGIPEDAFLISSVGRLVWAKGYDDFIQAFGSLVDRLPKAYAVIIGEGILHSALEERIKNSGLVNHIRLLGHYDVGKTLNMVRASDVFVLSSRSEGVPYALLEAAALGLPIVSTRCGGIPDIFTDNVDALLIPIGDSAALSSALIRLWEDRTFAKWIASNAKAKIERDRSISTHIDAIRQAYAMALDHHKAKTRR